ncbi:hypothetical protein L1I30_13865 [Gillisia sp. M10.2A]|uniref:DUF4468 domain-containing protein n=1 Tax=Gillisia lutea TaxID=2909668 RepID=A0ABS9EIT4_9FLAO|nr:hypothetical protein [Gillisia lutea]MCF4102760.1 hypothetical protein [Gillisia lutea]
MKIKIITAVFLTLTFIGYSQGFNPFDAGNSRNQIQTKSSITNDLEGSPYFEDQFSPGIIQEEGVKNQTAYIRYNVVDDQIEVKVGPSQTEIYILPRQQKFTYKLKDYYYALGSYKVKDVGVINGFIINYYSSDNIIFIAKPSSKVIPGQIAKTGYEKAKPATLDIDVNYYIGQPGSTFEEVRLKEKDFKKLLGDKKGMKEYFDNNRIKDIEDVVNMLKYYDTIK